jgi:hypothetical protein
MTYYITKYAATDGEIVAVSGDGVEVDASGKYIRRVSGFDSFISFSAKEWSTDEAEARKQVADNAKKKIASLKKQMAKLQKIADGDIKVIHRGKS